MMQATFCPEIKLDTNVTPRVSAGDVWLLGRHRLMCGNSTSEADVSKLLDGVKADSIICDPPFAVRNDAWDSFQTTAAFVEFTASWLSLGKQHANTVVCFIGNKTMPLLLKAAERADIEYHRALIWRKPPGSQFAGAALDGFWYDFEEIEVFGKPTFKPDSHNKMAVLEYRTVTGQEHGCEKPRGLLRDLIEGYTQEDGIVIDFFTGTGTTLLAAEEANRTCYGMELDPHNCDVILYRWEHETGARAVKI